MRKGGNAIDAAVATGMAIGAVEPWMSGIGGVGFLLLTTADGRFTILMPHPERVFRSVLMSWHPEGWGEDGPWMRMFRNARAWLG